MMVRSTLDMATFDELALDYASRIVSSDGEALVLRQIASEINGLVYLNTRRPLSLEDKDLLAEKIGAAIPKAKQPRPGGGFSVLGTDPTAYLAVMADLKRLIRK